MRLFLQYAFSICASSNHQLGCRNNCTADMHASFLQYVWPCVFLGYQLVCSSRYTVCSWKAFLLNGWACVSWGFQLVWRRSYTVCSWKALRLSGLACVSWGYQIVCRRSHTVCSWKAFRLNGWACVSSGYQLVCRRSYIVCSWKSSFPNDSSCVSWGYQLVCRRLLSTMNPHVDFQISSTYGWKATLVAKVGLLSTGLKHVCFKAFGFLEGKRALNTWVGFVFSLQFHCRSHFTMCCLINHSWITEHSRSYFRSWALFEKWKW